MTPPRFRWLDLLWFALVVAAAAGTRAWYLSDCLDQATDNVPLRAQDPWRAVQLPEGVQPTPLGDSTELGLLVHNLVGYRWFGTVAPLGEQEEVTAHIAPGYPGLVALLASTGYPQPRVLVRWVQAGLGALACGCYFFFARWAFNSIAVGLLAGLLCAFHPLWVINVAEIHDGTLTSFLLSLCLLLGVRGTQVGGVFRSLVLGVALAALSLVRAALLPFALLGLVWFLLRCSHIKRGWLCALVAFLGFINTVAPWAVRNWQAFGEVLPVNSTVWLQLAEGILPGKTGTPLTDAELRTTLGAEKVQQLQTEPNQACRYQKLASEVLAYAQDHPGEVVYGRFRNLLCFFLGRDLLVSTGRQNLPQPGKVGSLDTLPGWLAEHYWLIFYGLLLATAVLAPLGWRWSFAWRNHAGLGTLALLLVPLPYILGHAENLWGPRLPLDGLLLTLAALGVLCCVPRVGRKLRQGEEGK